MLAAATGTELEESDPFAVCEEDEDELATIREQHPNTVYVNCHEMLTSEYSDLLLPL